MYLPFLAESVFSVNGVRLTRDPGRRQNNHRTATGQMNTKGRRQSMLI